MKANQVLQGCGQLLTRAARAAALAAIVLVAVCAQPSQAAGGDWPAPPAPGAFRAAAAASPQQGVQIVRGGDGRLEAFCWCVYNGLKHTYQVVPNGPWVPWETFPGSFIDVPTVISNTDGRLELFAKSPTGGAVHAWQMWVGGPFSAFASLDAGAPVYKSPAVTRNADGRLEAFYQNCTGAGGVCAASERVMHTWQVSPGGAWSSPVQLSPVAIGPAPITVFSNVNGTIELYLFNGTGLYGAKQTGVTWTLSTPSAPPGAPTSLFPFSVATNLDGRVELFAPTGSGLFHRWQTTPSGAWSDWYVLSALTTDNVTAGRNADGRIEVFSSTDATWTTWHVWQNAPGAGWSSSVPLPGGGSVRYAAGVATNADSRLEVFLFEFNADLVSGNLYHSWQQNPSLGPWSPVFPLP